MTTRPEPAPSVAGAPGRSDAPQEPTRLARGTMLAAATLTIMAAAIIAPSLPAMSEVFSGTPGADLLVRLVLTVTSLAIGISAPLSGLVADRIGRRPLLLAGLVVYAVSGTAGLFVTDLYVLLATRIVLGLAVGGIMTAVSATLVDWYEGPRRAMFLGLQQAFASLGGVMFLPLAGVLAAVDWRAPFSIYAVAALVALFAVLTPPGGPGTRTAALGHQAAPRHSTGGRIAGIYALALVATLVFFMAPTQLPFMLGDFGSGPAVIGAVIAGSTLTGAVGALAFPRLHSRVPATAITTISVALLGVGWLLVGTAGTVAAVVVGLLVGGIGVGLVVPNLNLRLGELARPDRRGRILSGLVTGIFVGQFLSPLVVSPLVRIAGIAGTFVWTGAAMTAGAALATLGWWSTRVRRVDAERTMTPKG